MPAFFDEISTLPSLCWHHSFTSESNHLWPYLQKGDDIIIMVILKFCQKMLAWKLSHPLNLENEILMRFCCQSLFTSGSQTSHVHLREVECKYIVSNTLDDMYPPRSS